MPAWPSGGEKPSDCQVPLKPVAATSWGVFEGSEAFWFLSLSPHSPLQRQIPFGVAGEGLWSARYGAESGWLVGRGMEARAASLCGLRHWGCLLCMYDLAGLRRASLDNWGLGTPTGKQGLPLVPARVGSLVTG